VYDVEAWTDMLPVFGGDSYTWTDNFMNGRANGLATYRNSDFFGLVDGLNSRCSIRVRTKVQRKEDQEGTKTVIKMYVSRTATASVCLPPMTFWRSSGLSLGAAYSSSDRTNEQERQARKRVYGGEKAEAWTVGAKYDANSVYLAMMYAETRNMTPSVIWYRQPDSEL
jgi:outer membrane protein N